MSSMAAGGTAWGLSGRARARCTGKKRALLARSTCHRGCTAGRTPPGWHSPTRPSGTRAEARHSCCAAPSRRVLCALPLAPRACPRRQAPKGACACPRCARAGQIGAARALSLACAHCALRLGRAALSGHLERATRISAVRAAACKRARHLRSARSLSRAALALRCAGASCALVARARSWALDDGPSAPLQPCRSISPPCPAATCWAPLPAP